MTRAVLTAALCGVTAAAFAQVPAGGELRVNTYTTGRQEQARIAMDADGDFVVVWQDRGQPSGAFGRRFAATGVPQGGEFRVAAYTTSSAYGHPAVAAARNGDFIVAWTSLRSGWFHIDGQRFDAGGAPVGAAFEVNSSTPGLQSRPRVARAPDGRFVVTWPAEFGDGGYGVRARNFDAGGSPMAGDYLVNAYTTGSQSAPDVAMAEDGSFVAVWNEVASGRDGIFGRRFDATGQPLGGDFPVNSDTTFEQRSPSVSATPGGGFVVAWESAEYVVSPWHAFARRYDAAGTPMGGDFSVSVSAPSSDPGGRGPQVAHDDLANFVVAWRGRFGTATDDIFIQRFDASGARRGTEIRVNAYTTGIQSDPMIASDAVGNFVVGWMGPQVDEDDLGLFAQRFGGLSPTALRVNVFGNAVIEPGELADIRPTWRNSNGAAQTFTATVGNPGGPANGVPLLLDTVGVYGTVPDGGSAECTTFYNLVFPDPPVRPATHWDGTVVETIVPDAHGQQKQWRLHVGKSFSDVQVASPFYRFVETLLHHGVTAGCGAAQYCPSDVTTREQMAVFVLVGKEGAGYVPPACGVPVFADVPAGSPYCRWIEELARRGVVSGCGGGLYCPASSVTREQMAVFVLRTHEPALSPPPCATPMYGDVPAASPFCRWIEELARRNVVTGCGGGNYCPTAQVTREQMGVFISVTFGLALYGP